MFLSALNVFKALSNIVALSLNKLSVMFCSPNKSTLVAVVNSTFIACLTIDSASVTLLGSVSFSNFKIAACLDLS